jgi:hypothetical protein
VYRLENHPANGKQGPEEMFQTLLTNENQRKSTRQLHY